jgi:hypothetical protein
MGEPTGPATERGELTRLREKYGDTWEIWVVHRPYGGPVWCARKHDDHKHVLHAPSPRELKQKICEAEHA